MTGDQTAIPVPVEPEEGACQWCGTPTRTKLVLEQRWTKAANGQRVPRSTKWAWVCSTHERTLKRRGDAEA